MHQKEYQLDQVDREILGLLQRNARISNADIARELSMAPSAVLERVKKLEQKNTILQYTTRLNPSALHQNLLAYVFIKASDGIGCNDTASALAAIPEVQEVHHVAGDDCYLVKVRTFDSASLMELMRNSIGKIPNILSTRTTIVLETVKEQQQLVIPTK
ncbi:MAG: AsnC family transcriptional regulator [Sphingobacteriales bacterium 17-39-43]|uniref:Lrp/AsnC family transcriptional regulator n=1 Tax=Daejeonella sp. TaxID=2805397 RepID=UPI000BD16B8F|nr:Lrp/AsnC family transcriptional regulator [Daejeonella sp.]OYZ31086.1 MAG: AsnC family transcriptional regulator [Sphingobacteriales bacterium 16-39-50]OYZ56655.1 MAG: AsnC family transcriptional regulator [Sphingobacteriales bacterium 24-40-4]OZA23927.1 MAG: AsnC family transcriptional regulator [Sphingobacteriales bacterium 17-39-43]OZA53961.1 MAG: AsnC family transcriptional regulator [Sphingobacteriales bacterium 39-40-5]HQS05675.1 Lrp/AsnC family transcriptional regulator [Daejeonella 